MAFRDWLGRTRPLAVESLPRGLSFESNDPTLLTGPTGSIDPAFFGPAYVAAQADGLAPVAPVSRRLAASVPAVKRARDLVCGTLGTVPLQVVDTENVSTVNALLDQPEVNVARSVTMTRLYEDLFYDAVAWWKVKATNFRNYPTTVERLAPDRVDVRDDGKTYVDGRVATGTLIQFLSPNAGLLIDGARAIRTLLRLEFTAQAYADDPRMQGFFTPAEDVDPGDDDEIRQMLRDWRTARQQGTTGYVPAALKYETVPGFSPEQMQLVESRAAAVLEIARLTGVDPADLGVSVGSGRTYQNAQDARRQRINDVLGPYATAVTDRLRMHDVTPLGYEVRADFTAFLRADDATRLGNYATGIGMGLYTVADVAAREGLPAPTSPPPVAQQPAPPSITVRQLPSDQKEIEA